MCTLVFTPPVVGSGIRALTYATDENTPAPPIGNLYTFTPSGFVDAGEAGISGGSLVIGAMYGILNVANISFTGQAVGLPPAAQGVSLGALMGSSTADLAVKNSISSNTGGSEQRGCLSRPIEDIVLRWVDVEVVDVDWSRGVVGGADGARASGKKTENRRK